MNPAIKSMRAMIAMQERKEKMKKDIEELMERNQWKQSQLAAAVGVHESTVYRWVSEGAMPIHVIQNIITDLLEQARKRGKTPARQTA